MNLTDVMSGVGIVIDDALENAAANSDDNSGDVQFLHAAKDYFVPVFIFTNESADDVTSSLPDLINDSLRGRMRTNAFEKEIIGPADADVPEEELRVLIGEASFRPQTTLPETEIGCGDIFGQSKGKYLLNLRPDCDCVPRDGTELGAVELHCVEGKRMSDAALRDRYEDGHFNERVWESIAFSGHDGRSVRFDFRKLRLQKFSDLQKRRIGRLLHPYLTRIQQRFGLYQQRQGLPRIPEAAIPANRPQDGEAES